MRVDDVTRVCVYCDTWAGGGIETFIARCLTCMDLTGLDVDIWCAQKDSERYIQDLEAAGILVQCLQKRENRSALKKTLGSIVPLYRVCKDRNYDVVHLNVFQGVSLLLAMAARLGGAANVIVHSHGAGLRNSRSHGLKYAVHAVSKYLFAFAPKQRWAASGAAGAFMFPRRFQPQIVPNGIDARQFLFQREVRESVRAELGIQNKKVLGCVGRLDSQKNQSYLLDIVAMLNERKENVALLLVGEGEDMPELKRKAERLGISEQVIFCGYRGDVPQLMWAMDVLLVPSLAEGLCIAALEGQAAGLPVICSTGVPTEVSVCRSVYFEPLSDSERWVDRIRSCETVDRVRQNEEIRQSVFQIEKSCTVVRESYLRGRSGRGKCDRC